MNGLSQNVIARIAHISVHGVQDVLEAARGRSVSWEDVKGVREEEAYALLFLGRDDRLMRLSFVCSLKKSLTLILTVAFGLSCKMTYRAICYECR